MSEFISWVQQNWSEAGTLLVEITFLITGVWFARNILKTARAFQEQVGALLRLSITAPAEPHSTEANAKRSFAEASPYWLTPPEPQTVTPVPEAQTVTPASEPGYSGPNRFVVACRGVVRWLQAPMTSRS